MNVTLLAPPHCLFWIVEPPAEQAWVSVQVEPSGMPYSQSTLVSSLAVTWKVSMEKVSSPEQLMDGASSRLAVMHLLWKPERGMRSRLEENELEQVKPEKELLP